MHPEENFDQEIAELLKEHPKSPTSDVIIAVTALYDPSSSYFLMFKDTAYRLGIEISIEKRTDKKNKKQGFVPVMKYTALNKIDEEPREEELSKRPLSTAKAYSILADKVVKRFMEIEDLEEKIEV